MNELESRIIAILSDQLGIPPADIHPTSKLVEELDADSLALIQIAQILEEEFDCVIDDQEIWATRTVEELCELVEGILAKETVK